MELKGICKNRIISKDRYRLINIDNKNLVYEVDIYKTMDLQVVEVQFSSLKKAEDFFPPAWFGEDVTDNPKYKNQYLACHQLQD